MIGFQNSDKISWRVHFPSEKVPGVLSGLINDYPDLQIQPWLMNFQVVILSSLSLDMTFTPR